VRTERGCRITNASQSAQLTHEFQLPLVALLFAPPPPGSGYVKYTFSIPPSKTLPITLGQPLTLCTLSPSNNVVKSTFYPTTPRSKTGEFIVVGTKGTRDDEGVWGKDKASFDSVLHGSMALGDEVAIKPGPKNLAYRGSALPVRSILYVCNGLGVTPMINQIREILNSPTSSVSSCTVVWVNERGDEFFEDAYKALEEQFYKHPTKLDVSCCIEKDVYSGNLGGNEEVNKGVPEYEEGAMVVVGGT